MTLVVKETSSEEFWTYLCTYQAADGSNSKAKDKCQKPIIRICIYTTVWGLQGFAFTHFLTRWVKSTHQCFLATLLSPLYENNLISKDEFWRGQPF